MDERAKAELVRLTTENLRLELRVAELEHGPEEETRDRVAEFMAAEEKDDEGMEGHHQAAWAGLPLGKIKKYWDSDEGDFVFPEGWPPGVEPEAYFHAYLGDRSPPAADEAEDTEMHRQYRELIGAGGD